MVSIVQSMMNAGKKFCPIWFDVKQGSGLGFLIVRQQGKLVKNLESRIFRSPENKRKRRIFNFICGSRKFIDFRNFFYLFK